MGVAWFPRLIVRRPILSLVLVALGLVGVWWIAVLHVTDPVPHQAVLDELPIPASWELAHEEILRNFWAIDTGSRVERYYLVDADPTAVVTPAERMLTEAGFTVDVRHAPPDWCDTPPYDSAAVCPQKVISPCWTNGPNGPTTCHLSARRGEECIRVAALDRGEKAIYYRGMDQFHVSDPVRIVVMVIDVWSGPIPCM